VEGLELAVPKPALEFGGVGHDCLAYRRVHQELSLSEVEEWQDAYITSHYDAKPVQADEWRNAGRLMDLMHAYNETYPVEPWDRILGVEEGFEILVGEIERNPKGLPGFDGMDHRPVPVYLHGFKDCVVEWHGGMWVNDDKTTKEWGDPDTNKSLLEGRMSFQFRAYPWAQRETQRLLGTPGLPVLGTIGNYLIFRKPYEVGYKPRANATPRNQFHMECYPFSDELLDEWQIECLDAAASILHDWTRGIWKRCRSGCGHWGRCEFYDICGAEPKDRDGIMQSSLYQPRTPVQGFETNS
jgi:hypothetical protein